jgi:hypothetical protein
MSYSKEVIESCSREGCSISGPRRESQYKEGKSVQTNAISKGGTLGG